jgi:hypothetical protein
MTTSAVSRSLLRLRRDQRGVTAVIVALTLPVLFAFGALAINSGLWFTIKRENQSAADAAAISAAYELMAGNIDVTNNLIPAATEAAAPTQNGYAGSVLTACTTGGTCCLESIPLSEVCYPYTDSLLDIEFGAGKYQAVAVTLVQSQGSLFAFAPLTSATIATKAVGVIKVFDNPCMLALGTHRCRGPGPLQHYHAGLLDSRQFDRPGRDRHSRQRRLDNRRYARNFRPGRLPRKPG